VRIFISYRRGEDLRTMRDLRAKLARRFRGRNVFLDTANIRGGEDFWLRIKAEIGRSDVVLAVMGAQWQPERLSNDTDFVRQELLLARSQGKRVIPVLLDGRLAVTEADVPAELAFLARLNAMPIGPPPGDIADMDRLAQEIGQKLGAPVSAAVVGSWRGPRRAVMMVTVLVVAPVALVAYTSWRRSDSVGANSPGRVTTKSVGVTTEVERPASTNVTTTFISSSTTATKPATTSIQGDTRSLSVEPGNVACDPKPEPSVCLRGLGRAQDGRVLARIETYGFISSLSELHVHLYLNTPELEVSPANAGMPGDSSIWEIPTNPRATAQFLWVLSPDKSARVLKDVSSQVCVMVGNPEVHTVRVDTGNCRSVS
jgi:TIR domain